MPLAAALHSQDSPQRLPVHGDGDEIISRRDGRGATEAPPTEPAPPTGNRCPTEGLRHESQRAEATTAPPAAGGLTGTPQQVTERREERGVGRPFAGLAAAFATPPGRGQRADRRRRARGRLTGTFHESSGDKRGSGVTTAAAATSASTGTESEALRETLDIACEQRGFDRLALLRGAAGFRQTGEDHIDPSNEPCRVTLLRCRERDP